MQPRSRCGNSQADGVWDGTLLVEYALRTECVANEALSAHAATGPSRGDDGPFLVSLARGARLLLRAIEQSSEIMQIVTSTVRGYCVDLCKKALPL